MSPLSPFRDAAPLPALHEGAWLSEGHDPVGGEVPSAPPSVPSPFVQPGGGTALAELDGLGIGPGRLAGEAGDDHPILRVYRLPPGALDALRREEWSLAMSLAAGAGFRDANTLTNIIFLYQHPEVVGRRILPEERGLASEWILIRDNVVKPWLRASADAGAAGAAPAGAPSAAAPDPEAWASRLRWSGASDEKLAFMRAVYVRHARNARGTFVMDLPEGQLRTIEQNHRAHIDAVPWARSMLAEARTALEAEHPRKYRIGIVSAYRSATEQFRIWQGREPDKGFPYYYRQAIRLGLVREGDHSPAAVMAVARHLGRFIASPGYSNHQDGLALDLGIGLARGYLGKIGVESWLFKWLHDDHRGNAKRFRFRPLADEPWHWIYTPPAGGAAVSREDARGGVRAGELSIERVPLLRRHRGRQPDLMLGWNDMASVPEAIDVVVHLHGYGRARATLPSSFRRYSGLDLVPVGGATGQGRTRPTLTVLPRGHDTGVVNAYGLYRYVFPAIVGRKGFDSLIQLALERFAAQIGASTPRIGRLILTAHSGGGAALGQILAHRRPDEVHEVHLFDALYQDPTPVARWAKRRIELDRAALEAGRAPAGALRVLYGKGTVGWSRRLASSIERELERSPAVLRRCYRVERSPDNHWTIPRRYGWRVLADATADAPDAYVEKLTRRELEEAEELEAMWAQDGLLEEHDDVLGGHEHEHADPLELEGFGGPGDDDVGALEHLDPPGDDAVGAFEHEDVGAFEHEDVGAFEHEDVGSPAEELDEATPDELYAHAPSETLERPLAGEALAHDAEDDEARFAAPAPALDSEAGGITAFIRRAYELAAIGARIRAGQRDPKELTNAIFYMRHPDREGTRIKASEKELAREWAEIRMRMVLPLLFSGPAEGPMHAPPGTPLAPELRKGVPPGTELSPLSITRRGLRQATEPQPRSGIAAIVVHCTSRGPVKRASQQGYRKPAVAYALNWYLNGDGGFPHYVIDFNGTIYATCDEHRIAYHSGWVHKGRRALFESGSWQAPEWWSRIWQPQGAATPIDLLPAGVRSPNARTLGIELMILPDLSYTPAQYRALARLVVDIAERNPAVRIPAAPSRGLLGHEDFAPVKGDGGRENAGGGWDPGAHRADPYFSWSRVWTEIQQVAPGFGAGHGTTKELLDEHAPLAGEPVADELFVDELFEDEAWDDVPV